MAIRTIFLMAEDCAEGRRLGWEEFVRDYAGVARRLSEHYFPTLLPEIKKHVAAIFQRARANNSAWFSTIRFTNEREFMMAFRDLVLTYGSERTEAPHAAISLDQVREIMKDQPLVEREMLWLLIKGYTPQQIAAIMMNAAATAEELKKVADERLSRAVPGSLPEALTTSARALMEVAQSARTEECPQLKTFNNIVNGQISWRERDLAEEHMAECFHCIDRFTAFLEMVRLRIDTPPAEAAEVTAISGQLALPPSKPKSMLQRIFSRA